MSDLVAHSIAVAIAARAEARSCGWRARCNVRRDMKTTLLWASVAPAVAAMLAACGGDDAFSGAACDPSQYPYFCSDAGGAVPEPACGYSPVDGTYTYCPDAGAPDTGAAPRTTEAGVDAGGQDAADAGAEADAASEAACDTAGVQVVASGQSDPGIVAADASALYWFDFSGTDAAPVATLMTTSLSGSAPAALVTVSGAPRSIAVAAGVVYWTDIFSGTVMSVPTSGGAATRLAAAQNQPVGIAVDAASVYWTTWAGGAVMKAPVGGGKPVVLADGQGQPGPLAMDSQNLYWADGTGEIVKLPLAGGAPVVLARGQSAVDVAVDAANVYWVNEGATAGSGSLMAVPIAGGEIVTLASGMTDPEHVASDGTSLYVSTGDVELLRIDPATGAAAVVGLSSACLREDPFAIAVAGAQVYWTNTLAGTVLMAAK